MVDVYPTWTREQRLRLLPPGPHRRDPNVPTWATQMFLRLYNGKIGSRGFFTLPAGEAAVTYCDERVEQTAWVGLLPEDASSAQSLNKPYWVTVGPKKFTVNFVTAADNVGGQVQFVMLG